ncbi:MAG: CaiB/BaiF CoA transferase family protein [Myxococcota bacterium]
MAAPLAGIRVVELASFVAAPAGGALLADLGAEVIKIEVPQGEIYRYGVPRAFGLDSDFPESPGFQMDNRGKRSLALDLGRPQAREALLRVIDRSDVMLTNMLPGRLRRYGLDPETLRAGRPELIVAMLTGYGSEGEDADRPSFDYAAYWARSGMMDLMRDQTLPPSFQRPGVGDHAAGLSLTCGVLAALRTRDRTGEGQLVEVSLLQTGLYVLGNDVMLSLVARQTPRRHDRTRPTNPLWNHYRTQDDRWLFLVMIDPDRYWRDFCEAIERLELLEDERFKGILERYAHSAELVAILDEVFSARSLSEWEKRFEGRRLIWEPARELREVLDDPQIRAMGYFATVDHPRAGRFDSVGPPVRMSAYPMTGERPAPALGADTEAVLREAGLDDAEIAAALAKAPGSEAG